MPDSINEKGCFFFLFLNINQLDALNFYNKFISSLYMFRAHVLIVRRAKLYYTVSGIITLKQVKGCVSIGLMLQLYSERTWSEPRPNYGLS